MLQAVDVSTQSCTYKGQSSSLIWLQTCFYSIQTTCNTIHIVHMKTWNHFYELIYFHKMLKFSSTNEHKSGISAGFPNLKHLMECFVSCRLWKGKCNVLVAIVKATTRNLPITYWYCVDLSCPCWQKDQFFPEWRLPRSTTATSCKDLDLACACVCYGSERKKGRTSFW